MNIRSRIVLLVFSLIIVGSGLAFWQFADVSHEWRVQLAGQESLRESAFARQLAQLTNRNLQDNLHTLISREQGARSAGLSPAHESSLTQFLDESPFLAIAVLKVDKDQWRPEWQRHRTQVQGRWPEGFLAGLLHDLPVDRAGAGTVTWFRSADPGQQTLFCLLTPFQHGEERVVAVGILPVTAMQAVTEAFVGSGLQMAVIDERGFALAFSEQAYVGSNLTEAEPAVGEVLKKREVSSQFGSVTREKRKIQVASKRVDGSNLYVLAGVPVEGVWAAFPLLFKSGFLMGLAVFLIFAGLGAWLVNPLQGAYRYLVEQLAHVANGEPVAYFAQDNPFLTPIKATVEKLISGTQGEAPEFIKEATAKQVENEKMGAYREIGVGLAQALKDPLAAVLAQAQLARSKAAGTELKDHFVIIEREARKARDTMDELLKLSGEDKFPRARVDVQEVVLAALAAQKGLLASHNVKVNKDLAQSISIQAHPGQLQTAVEEVIKNAVEAMKSQSDRQLKVSTAQSGGWLQLKIEDTGVGLNSDELGRIFDPFFTTKTKEDHKGLGLTVAKGIMKGFGGRIRVESAGAGSGATMIFEFPASPAAVAAEEKARPAPTAKSLEMPLTGTQSDHLPTAPAPDEVTLTSLKVDEEMPLRPAKIKEGNS